jgi:lipopolysaccharide/colanic/teichoic acid biosynthesis glycosyltransferase/glycosyltransferase involved in cell wall biosynthesis
MGDRRPRVAHLTTVDSSLRYLVLPQLLAVQQAGGEAIGISAPGPFVDEIEDRGIRHIPLPSSTRGVDLTADLRAALELWRILRREQIDVLHTHNPKPGIYGRIVGRLAGVPLVVNTVHGLYATENDSRSKRTVVYLLEAIASRFSHVELVQSKEDLEVLTRLHISPRGKTSWLGNGVDLVRFNPRRFSSEDRKNIRKELGIDPDAVVVGTVARLVAEKGYPELFEAAKAFDHGIIFVCVGPDDPEKVDALPRQTLEEAKEQGVRFVGMRDDVDRLYVAMDIFVLPSHREGFPRAAMEAAAMGLPIIATDIRGCREVVKPNRSGLLVSVGRPDELAGAIARLADSPELRSQMGSQSREKALAEFDESRIVQTVLEAYGLRHNGSEGDDRRQVTSTAHRFRYRVVKRAFDAVLSAFLLVLLAPVLGLIAFLVRARLGRPVLFRQERPGLNGEIFTLIKFRTMTEAVDERGQTLPDSERMTTLGRVLRSLSLDELPELVNVLRGEMSMVGPRPLLPRYLERFNPRQSRRHEVKPGLTGWAQIKGRNDMSWEDKLEMDVWYGENWSLGLDLRICLETLGVVARRTGVSQAGEATASEFMGTQTEEEGK